MILAVVVLSVIVAILAADNARLRLRLHRIVDERAQRTAEALTGLTLVDGVLLPLTDDPRWEITKYRTTVKPDEDQLGLAIGGITIDKGVLVGSSPILLADAHRAYAAEVWRAYRTRIAKKTSNEQLK